MDKRFPEAITTWRFYALNENIENIEVSKALYFQLETTIAAMDLLCSSFNDYEEQMKNLTNNTTNGKNRKRKQKSFPEIKFY